MTSVRANPGEPFQPPHGPQGAGGRLNLLLSYAGWHPDPWVDRLPRLLEPMGVVSHKVGTGLEASRLISTMPIHVAVVDMALPLEAARPEVEPEFEEGGPRLLELLRRLEEPPPVVAIKRTRTHRDDSRDITAALRMGAFAILDRPQTTADLNVVLDVLRRCLERHYRGRWPGAV
jgi:CheY-like chemotaxis protein